MNNKAKSLRLNFELVFLILLVQQATADAKSCRTSDDCPESFCCFLESLNTGKNRLDKLDHLEDVSHC